MRDKAKLLRAVLLLVAWTSSGVWSVGHALEHELDHEHGSHVERPVEPHVEFSETHHHGHSHPEPLPVVLGGKAPVFETLALQATTPEVARANAATAWLARTAPACTIARILAPSGPRAPPVS